MTSKIKNVKEIQFKYFHDSNGVLIPIEGKNNIPFAMKRIFYIYDLINGDLRGKHAHRKCQQILICIKGECEVICDDGCQKKTFILNDPKVGLYIPPMIWSSQKFNKDNSILLVLTDKNFTESDYIRDYKKFLTLI